MGSFNRSSKANVRVRVQYFFLGGGWSSIPFQLRVVSLEEGRVPVVRAVQRAHSLLGRQCFHVLHQRRKGERTWTADMQGEHHDMQGEHHDMR